MLAAVEHIRYAIMINANNIANSLQALTLRAILFFV